MPFRFKTSFPPCDEKVKPEDQAYEIFILDRMKWDPRWYYYDFDQWYKEFWNPPPPPKPAVIQSDPPRKSAVATWKSYKKAKMEVRKRNPKRGWSKVDSYDTMMDAAMLMGIDEDAVMHLEEEQARHDVFGEADGDDDGWFVM